VPPPNLFGGEKQFAAMKIAPDSSVSSTNPGSSEPTAGRNRMRHFTKPDDEDIRFFRDIAGDKNVISGGDDIEPYSHDETEDYRFAPDVVVKPSDTAQVCAVMKRCFERGIAVTPRGGGTGLSGGALCVFGGVCLSFERMNKILDIDTKNFMATVQPGVVVETLHNEVEALGLFYPPDPASKGSCTLGGNIAECAGGARAMKYGTTKDYVLAVEAVLPDGRPFRAGAKTLKNATGYNLVQLLIGSEGTLAAVTEATVKLIPAPLVRRTLLAPFDSLETAAAALNELFLKRVSPCAVEFMEKEAIKSAERMLERSFPYSDSEALLLIELDGSDADAVNADVEKAGGILLEEGALDALVAEAGHRQNEMWDMRRAVGEAVKKISVYKEEDTVVPRAALPALMRSIKSIADRHGFTAICYGHAGDGNIHANIIKGDMDELRWRRDLPALIADIHRAVVGLDGTISGEHGIGFSQKEFMPIAVSQTALEIMISVKRAFDPKGILNPGKIFPDAPGEGTSHSGGGQ